MAHQAASGGEQRLDTLDAMRGLAAIVVMLWHADIVDRDSVHGYLAVDFFFLLSGFVIARTYEARLGPGGLTAMGFLRARLLRLYPMYAVGLILGLAVATMGLLLGTDRAPSLVELANRATFGLFVLPAPGEDLLMPLNIPTWSLFMELAVNIAFCLVMFRARSSVLALVALLFGSLMIVGASIYGHVDWGATADTVVGGLIRVTYGFTLGVLMWRLGGKDVGRTSVLSILPCLLLLLALLTSSTGRPAMIHTIVLVAAGFPALLAAGGRWSPPAALQPACRWLGNLSYPLYVIHVPLLAVRNFALQAGLPRELVIPCFVAGLIITAWALGAWLDPYLRRGLTRLTLPKARYSSPSPA
jgi:peptidoglycan/LPS O-acetylase OafA/YrhL